MLLQFTPNPFLKDIQFHILQKKKKKHEHNYTIKIFHSLQNAHKELKKAVIWCPYFIKDSVYFFSPVMVIENFCRFLFLHAMKYEYFQQSFPRILVVTAIQNMQFCLRLKQNLGNLHFNISYFFLDLKKNICAKFDNIGFKIGYSVAKCIEIIWSLRFCIEHFDPNIAIKFKWLYLKEFWIYWYQLCKIICIWLN